MNFQILLTCIFYVCSSIYIILIINKYISKKVFLICKILLFKILDEIFKKSNVLKIISFLSMINNCICNVYQKKIPNIMINKVFEIARK